MSNEIIEKISIVIQAHSGNLPSVTLYGHDRYIMANVNNLDSAGYLLRELVEFFGIHMGDAYDIAKVKNIPCRIVTDSNGEIVAIGRFMQDRFIKMDDLIHCKNQVSEKNQTPE